MKKVILPILTSLLLASCTNATPVEEAVQPSETNKIRVATSFYPLTHFAEQVGGDLVEVVQVAAPGVDPHSYEPTPRQIQQVYNADVFIYNGAGQDPYADRIHEEVANKGTVVLMALDLVDKIAYEQHEDEDHEEDDHDDHEEDDHDEHNHGEWDPHVWLDPLRAAEIVETVAVEFAKIVPEHATTFTSNAAAYAQQLRALDTEMQTGLRHCALDSVVVSHDAYRYLASRYNFNTLEIAGLSPSSEPSPARMAELTDLAEQKGIAHVFFETQVSPALSETLANEIGAKTLVLHSIEALTPEEQATGMTYIDVQRKNLHNLRTALQCS